MGRFPTLSPLLRVIDTFPQLCIRLLGLKSVVVAERLRELVLPCNRGGDARVLIVSVDLLWEAPCFVTELLAGCHVVSVSSFPVKEARDSHASTLPTLVSLLEQTGGRKGVCGTCILRETICDVVSIFALLLYFRQICGAFAHVFVGRMVHRSFRVIALSLIVAKSVDRRVRERVVGLSIGVRNPVRDSVLVLGVVLHVSPVLFEVVWVFLHAGRLLLLRIGRLRMCCVEDLHFD